MNEDQLENPVLGYVVIAAALVVGMLSATVFGQSPKPNAFTQRGPDPVVNQSKRSDAPPLPAASKKIQEQPPGECEPKKAVRRWILGVRSRPSNTGCLITSVVPRSPAERAGLAAGDRILAVNGRQVGWLEGQLHPLHQAIDAASKRTGHLLVQRGSSGSVQAISIRMSTIAESLGH